MNPPKKKIYITSVKCIEKLPWLYTQQNHDLKGIYYLPKARFSDDDNLYNESYNGMAA